MTAALPDAHLLAVDDADPDGNVGSPWTDAAIDDRAHLFGARRRGRSRDPEGYRSLQ